MYQPCESYLESLSLYVDELLTGEEKDLLETHLKACVGCQVTLHQWRRMATAIDAIPDEMPPADLRGRIFASTIHRRTWLDTLRSHLRPTWLWAPSAAALAMGIWVSTFVFRAPVQSLTDVVQGPPPQPMGTGQPITTLVPPPSNVPALSSATFTSRAQSHSPTLRVREETPRFIMQARLSRLNDVPTERRTTQPEVAVHDFVNDTPVNISPLGSEPNAPIDSNPPSSRATLVSDIELDGMLIRDSMQQQIREQLKRDSDDWRQLRMRNMKERRLNVPIVTIKF
jgi:hypothetical protein